MADLRKTIKLFESPVPMRAGLPTLEPRMVGEWKAKKIYERLREARSGSPRFILHDGPPYANGDLHMGHALNKTLKDIIVRYKALAGFDTPFVPGWDCHGLPIEHNVTRELGEKAAAMSQKEIRQLCRKYAEKWVDIQREGFIRLGCIGHWEDPYLTIDPNFEARIIEAFGELHRRGFIYRGQKPIHWCPSCRTALAASTAEAEYGNHKSDAITVAFRSKDDPTTSILIWTTTPWTLPANLAMAVRPELDYVTVNVSEKKFIVSQALLPQISEACGWSNPEIVKTEQGSALEGREFHHPFLDRISKIILGDFVTTEQGTGVVHIAPGHGQDDYIVGLKYGLPAFAPVDASGRFTKEAGVCEGQFVFDANKPIVELLQSRGALMHAEKIEHQYPHCWRCKGPIIFRATKQWFMSVDRGEKTTLREKAIAAAEAIQWIPSWGKDRFVGSVKERPDWCLSRQRAWGVPIPAYVCPECEESIIDDASLEEAKSLAKADRLDDWFSENAPTRKCPKCGAGMIRERDILDVWFDSGVSWFAADMVAGGSRKGDALPIADLYLEGSDQHRGWFQSSLWPSLAIRDTAPYFAVLTHGFMLDGEGRAMHKSAGNAISPAEILEKYGADIIRLWVASENYREDLRLSHDILGQVADTYRKIRNTWRFLSANIVDLPPSFSLPVEKRDELDAWANAVLGRYLARVRDAYENYAFHDVYRATLEFFANDLSAFYLDILKDRLYCDAEASISRRSAQVTCREILVTTLKCMAPILCFTSDEIWATVPSEKDSDESLSIHLATLPAPEKVDEPIIERLRPLLLARDVILKAIEEQRAAGVIKSSQMAAVTTPFGGDLDFLRRLCQVAELTKSEGVTVTATTKPKCPRCWRYLDFTGSICARCEEVISQLPE